MKLAFFILLISASVFAADYVVYDQVTGKIISYDKQYEIPKRALTQDGHGFYGPLTGTNILGILSTTNSPAGLTNIVQLSDQTVIDPTDLFNDYTQWTERERKMLSLIVKEINILRVNAGLAARTKKQVVQALKEE